MKEIISAGAFFYSLATTRFLFVHRSTRKYKNTWGLVGGKINEDESTFEGLIREIEEELGYLPSINKSIPLNLYTSDDKKFLYHTFIFVVNQEFVPMLNSEHNGYAWASIKGWPKPLHPGLFNTLTEEVVKEKIQTLIANLK